MQNVPDRMLKQLRQTFDYLLGLMASPEMTIGATCSGTDLSCVLVLQVMKLLQPHTGVVNLKHSFSCESVPWKRRWIASQFSPELIFEDVRRLGDATAMDTISKTNVAVPSVTLFTAGLSCRSLSNLNEGRLQYDACLEKGSRQHGRDVPRGPIVSPSIEASDRVARERCQHCVGQGPAGVQWSA